MDVDNVKRKGKLPGSGFGTRMVLLIGTNMAIIALFTVVAAIFGIEPSGIVGLAIFSALFGFGGAFISLFASKWIAKRSTGAQVIETPQNDTERWLVDTVGRLAAGAGIDMPEVAIYPSDDVNAFATGAKRNDALVAVSVGLLQQMHPDEIEAVLAHEVSHVANGDMVTLTLIQGVINTFVILISRLIAQVITETLMRGRGGRGVYFMIVIAVQIVLGFFASMIVMWFSRRREFRADAGSGALAGNDKMIRALEALRRDPPGTPLPEQVAAMGIRPSGGGGLKKLLMSHPPIGDRIAALR
jgi:heat shock protein HtpX